MGESDIPGVYLPSRHLHSTVKIRGQLTRAGLVFACLDDSLDALLAANPDVLPRASFVRLEPPSPFRLDLPALTAYSNFLALELVPFLHTVWGSSSLQIVLVGQQFSGVLAVYTAARFPIFSGALSISGSFWWKPTHASSWEWFTHQLAQSQGCPGHIYLLCDTAETLDRPRGVPTTLLANRHLRDVFTAKGCVLQLVEGSSKLTDNTQQLRRALNWFSLAAPLNSEAQF